MNTDRDEKFNAIVKEYEERTLDKLPKHQLDGYISFLTKCGSHNGFNVDTYNRICDYINSLLMHQETQKKLEELKKPHWTVLPIFWLAFVSASAAVIGIFISLNSRPQATVSTSHEPKKTELIQTPSKPEHQQNILKPISSSASSRGQGSQR